MCKNGRVQLRMTEIQIVWHHELKRLTHESSRRAFAGS